MVPYIKDIYEISMSLEYPFGDRTRLVNIYMENTTIFQFKMNTSVRMNEKDAQILYSDIKDVLKKKWGIKQLPDLDSTGIINCNIKNVGKISFDSRKGFQLTNSHLSYEEGQKVIWKVLRILEELSVN